MRRQKSLFYYLLVGGACLLILVSFGMWLVVCGTKDDPSARIDQPPARRPAVRKHQAMAYRGQDSLFYLSARPSTKTATQALQQGFLDTILEIVPDSDYSPFEESWADFAIRMPWAHYIVEPPKKKEAGVERYTVSGFVIGRNDDGEPTIKTNPLMIIDQLHDESVAVSSAETVKVPGFDKAIPLFEFACEAKDMTQAIEETRQWMDRYVLIQGDRFDSFDDPGIRRLLLEVQLLEFDDLLNSRSEFIQLRPDVLAALKNERNKLKAELPELQPHQ